MDKLYAAIFGVFTNSPEDDLNDFIDIVKSVISDDDSRPKPAKRFNIWLVLVFIMVVVTILLVLYLKVYW
ncbi:IMV membrane protein [Murmansk poxvirus]|uniref:IMV membrane protein n=1 Tax=Murmansk poxvirus TaxID=2025359 RepID=A0A223FMR9_9POXV|nr:IMV membrane protein [Murmansk poxvirus]AST09262.1 IMV membrane protein [Murmansk poxvirus]